MLQSVSHIATAWTLYYEILSRILEPIIPIMTHPCGEQYECLTVAYSEDGRLLSPILINLGGTAISAGSELLRYRDFMTSHQIMLLAEESAAAAGLRLNVKKYRAIRGFELYLNIMKTRENLLLRNAWYDGSYSFCLSEEAKAFPAYPVRDEQDALEHMKWWVLVSERTSVAIINVQTDQMILGNGKQYALATEYDGALAAILQTLPVTDFSDVVRETQQLLLDNPEWRERYTKYARTIQENTPVVQAIRQSFHEWAPLYLYMNVSNALRSTTRAHFELRYLGQTVAEIHHKENPVLDSSEYDALNLRDFGCDVQVRGAPWDSPSAAAFRRFFKERPPLRNDEGRGNHEHRLESLLLTELSKTTRKMLPHMRSVKVADLRFPMPTPLRASKHKQITYSGRYGGGIDILARAGFGRRAGLCILELKDENTKREPPRDAVKQALTYAVFIRELLRSEAGEQWWRLFGFSGNVLLSLCLTAACVMPSEGFMDYSFAGLELPIGQDTIKLHVIYFTEENNKILRVESSLNFLNQDGGE